MSLIVIVIRAMTDHILPHFSDLILTDLIIS